MSQSTNSPNNMGLKPIQIEHAAALHMAGNRDRPGVGIATVKESIRVMPMTQKMANRKPKNGLYTDD